MAKVDLLATNMDMHMHIDEEERSNILNDTISDSILDETDDEDSTQVLKARSSGKQVVVCTQSKARKPKFIPKSRITGPTSQGPEPSARQPAQARLDRLPPPSYVRKSVKERLIPYAKRTPAKVVTTPQPVPAPIHPISPTVDPSHVVGKYTAPQYTQPPVFFPTPPPPMPRYTEFMISTLTNTLIQHSKDSFSIKLNESEVKAFLRSSKKEYCF